MKTSENKHPLIALVETGSSSTHVYSMTYLPRVGIPTIGAVLKQNGCKCDIYFQSMSEVSSEQLKKYDIVGIGSLTNTIPDAYRLADSLRQTGTTVVMGGAHVTFMAEEALEHCSYVVIGEGDVSFPALVEALAVDESPEHIPGLAYCIPNGEIHYTASADPVDYENLPSPDFSLSPQMRAGSTPPILTTSRGCPHDCTFCSVTSVFGKLYRFKQNQQIIDELRPVLNRSVCFGDDNFCANRSRTKSLLRDMIAQDAVPLRWAGQMCVEAASDEELLDLMRDTRCRIMYVGIESIDAETLKKFGKAHKVDSIERCIENLHNRSIGIHGMFVVGMDDDVETPGRIVDFAIETGIDTIQICSLTPFPGTAVYVEYKDKLLHSEWKYFDGMHVVVDRKTCSAYDMQKSMVRELQRFYSFGRAVGGYRRGRSWRVKYRLGGYYLMRRWVKENADYMERLKKL